MRDVSGTGNQSGGGETRGQRLVRHMRGRGSAKQTEGLSTDELMELLRG
ncbi:hypothetical protein GA0070616_4530 [Micromonospora nigra]|uniref:Uncharacterized protein n=1 Tax=Micromonospora nigra TaxID=145857 RepID=A0A1C6ST57_9ACTN|nr:hypothetical protein [Micromonospora nigra]SCL32701.1 hypothetical protein GA0070616_4530 [Micromonospora nigra]